MVIYGIILAAGEGLRAGGNKLSMIIGQTPMLHHVIENALFSKLSGIILVTGCERSFGHKAAEKYGIEEIYNPCFKSGMSSSLKLGIKSLPDKADAFAVLLGDMPYIKRVTIDYLVDFYERSNFGIVIPTYRGHRGHPPIISVKYKSQILKISGDVGAREVIRTNLEDTVTLEVEDPGVLKDIDY